jgi:aspartokinase-like uncharacterized kinase
VAVERGVIVVKVGGSLYDHPRLGPGLRAYLDSLAPESVLLVPGGGPFADAVRQLDAAHRLGEEAAHWLALRAMDLAGAFLEGLALRPASRLNVLDCLAFATEDEARPDSLPHSWAVTSDSIAARAAVVYRASRLVLLKSTDVPPGTPWAAAAAAGWVDPHFPRVVAANRLTVAAVNFRQVLDSGRG